MRRVAAFFKRSVLSLLSFGVCFALAEIGLRLLVPRQTPGRTYGHAVFRNSDGFRDREFAVPKPEDTYRILVLGDSFTWGIGLPVEETIPKILERELSSTEREGRVEVINAAIPGYNTVEELVLLRERGLKYEPDLVLVVYNLNDIEYLPHLSLGTYAGLEAAPVVELDPGEAIAGYSKNRNLRARLEEVEKRSVLVRFLVPRVGALLRRTNLITSPEFSWVESIYQGFSDANPGWLESERALTGITEACREEGCGVLVAVYPLFANLEAYRGKDAHRKVLEFCEGLGVVAIDLLPAFEGSRTKSHWVNFIDAHPNGVAHRRAAEALIPRLREFVRGG